MSRIHFLLGGLLVASLFVLPGCKPKEQPAPAPAPAVVPEAIPAPAPESKPEPKPEAASEAHEGIVEIVGDAAFVKFIEETPIAVVDFNATWCGPCKMFVPDLQKVAADYKDKGLKVGSVDVDKNRSIATTYNIKGIPDVRFFVKGKEVDKIVGYSPEKLFKKAKQYASNPGETPSDYTQTPLEDELWNKSDSAKK